MSDYNGNSKRVYQIVISILVGLLMLFATGFIDDLKGGTDTEKRIATLEAKMEYMETNLARRLDRVEAKLDRLIEGR